MFPASPSWALCSPKNVVSLLHPLLFPLPLLRSCSWLHSLSMLWVLLSCRRQGAVDKSKQPEPCTLGPAHHSTVTPTLASHTCYRQAPPSSLLLSHGSPPPPRPPEAAGGRQSPPQALVSPGGSSPFPMPLQDSHKEAMGECICRRGAEAALCPGEGSKSSAGPGREGVHQPEAWGKGQGRALQRPALCLPPPRQTHLKAEPHSCSTACTTSSFSSQCSEQVE